MQTKVPTIGVRFDFAKTGNEVECWKTFWRAVDPATTPGALFYEGADRDGAYCIAVQCADPAIVEAVRSQLVAHPEFAQVSSTEPFEEGDKCAEKGLPHAGRIDTYGNLIGDAKHSRPALAAVRLESNAVAHVAAPVEAPKREPASERTIALPPILGFEQLKEYLKTAFAPAIANTRDLWITPEELCDVVEEFAWMLELGVSEQPSQHSENVLHVKLYDKDRHALEPLELAGLFAFASRGDVTSFLASYAANPAYSDALPDLAGLAGRFQVNFSRVIETRKKESVVETRIAPRELWPRLYARREAFGDELRQAWASVERRREAERQRLDEIARQEAEALRLQEEARAKDAAEREMKREEDRIRREEQADQLRMAIELEQAAYIDRRAQGRCIFCGKGLSVVEKMKKADKHKDCWRFEPDAS